MDVYQYLSVVGIYQWSASIGGRLIFGGLLEMKMSLENTAITGWIGEDYYELTACCHSIPMNPINRIPAL
jgi:hypothetical protein